MNNGNPPVTFDFATWIGLFPIFSACSPTQGANWFNRASFLCANDTTNPLFAEKAGSPTTMLETALYLLTSHIAWLDAPRDARGNPAATGKAPSPLVGRINQATEGSVSLGADMGDTNAGSPSQAWYMQTKYGAEYWAMTACVRQAVYVANPTIVPGTMYPGFPYGPLGYRRH